MSNPVVSAIMSRRSVRAYESTPVSPEHLQILIGAALASPSAVNRQPWHFSFATNAPLLREIDRAVAERMLASCPADKRAQFEDPGYSVSYRAPLVVFVSAPAEDSGKYGIDCGVAAENLAIAAQGLGLGSVILGMPREAFASEKGDAFRKALRFPEGFGFQIAVAIGHPAASKDAHPIGENKFAVIE